MAILINIIIAAAIVFILYYIRKRFKSLHYPLLMKESKMWIEKGIINESQQQDILTIYEKPPGRDLKKLVPIVVVSLGTVLLIVGLFLFYSANWKYMPATIKIIQVFILIISFYGVSYYLLNKTSHALIGRAFLILGMLSFGLGIALTAQVFHITAHGGTGTMIWFLSTFAMSWLMKEKGGYFIAAALLFLWMFQGFSHYNMPHYSFPLFGALLIWLFYKEKSPVGIVLMAVETIFWTLTMTIHYIPSFLGNSVFLRTFTWIILPLGLILALIGRIFYKDEVMKIPAKIFMVIGWVMAFAPFMILSWPMDNYQKLYMYSVEGIASINIVFSLTMIVAIAFIYGAIRLNKNVIIYIIAAALGLIIYFLPLGSKTVLVISTNIGLVVFIGSFLYLSRHDDFGSSLMRLEGALFIIAALLVKSIVFVSMGLNFRYFNLAYCAGALVFAVVCFLIIQTITLYNDESVPKLMDKVLTGISGIVIFFILYSLSFKMKEQRSIFTADPIVLVMLALFVSLAVAFYIFLFIKSKEKMLIVLSAIIFSITVGILLLSGPVLSWIVYSIIFNLLLFIMIAITVYYGITIESALIINVAIGGFILHVVTRYFDLLFDLLSGSVLFISTGIVVMTGGYFLERQRKRWIKAIKSHEVEGK